MYVCVCFSFLYVAVLGKNQIENMRARFIEFAIACFCIKRVRQVHVSMDGMNDLCLFRLRLCYLNLIFCMGFCNTMVRYELCSLNKTCLVLVFFLSILNEIC
mgnify:CR=1 FL=1